MSPPSPSVPEPPGPAAGGGSSSGWGKKEKEKETEGNAKMKTHGLLAVKSRRCCKRVGGSSGPPRVRLPGESPGDSLSTPRTRDCCTKDDDVRCVLSERAGKKDIRGTRERVVCRRPTAVFQFASSAAVSIPGTTKTTCMLRQHACSGRCTTLFARENIKTPPPHDATYSCDGLRQTPLLPSPGGSSEQRRKANKTTTTTGWVQHLQHLQNI